MQQKSLGCKCHFDLSHHSILFHRVKTRKKEKDFFRTVWFQNRRAKWRRQDKAESSAIAELPPVRPSGPTGIPSWTWMTHPEEFSGLMHPFVTQPNAFPPDMLQTVKAQRSSFCFGYLPAPHYTGTQSFPDFEIPNGPSILQTDKTSFE
ncbi:unnamed protein product [Dracunculus medinensis]|uniref:Homeobox domain-containing protein n=1 Tax=Dracunculus medinensis TaxID=318479 RepID=A0A0N4UGX1_DRAME|nr:unnamed protein product [Dracunculus medinensis]